MISLPIFENLHKFNRSPMAYITHPTTQLGAKPAPFMAAFSSKGPNTITPEILKVFLKSLPVFPSGFDY